GSRLVQLDVDPADLRLGETADLRARRAREQLDAEADAEDRSTLREQLLEPRDLLGEPGVRVFLVGMHRPAEDEIRVVGVERVRRFAIPREAPLVERVARPLDD